MPFPRRRRDRGLAAALRRARTSRPGGGFAAKAGSNLTLRYALALTLLASVLVVPHLIETRRIAGMADDARTIDVGGLQRLLSQRVALLARELALAEDPATSEVLAGRLALALDTFSDNHDRLASDWRVRAERGEAPYVELTSDTGLDAEVRRYIASGRSLLRHPVDAGEEASRLDGDAPDRLAAIARNGLSAELDAVVRRYERESVARADAIGRLATFATYVGLALLLAEALFVFRPMIRTIAATVDGLERANVKLEEANEELAQFNYRASHDIVSPISSARGYLALAIAEAEDDEPDPEELSELLRVACGQLDRLDALVVDLSSLARAGMDGARTERIELRALVDDVWLEHPDATPDGPAMETDLAFEEIDGDPTRLRQMLSNLIDNAVKYRDPNEGAPRIGVSVREEGASVVIEVSDNGIGIDPELGERAFEMFARGDASVPGTGLGLYIVSKHLDRLGGKLSLPSLAKPTIVRITLPPALTPA